MPLDTSFLGRFFKPGTLDRSSTRQDERWEITAMMRFLFGACAKFSGEFLGYCNVYCGRISMVQGVPASRVGRFKCNKW